MSNVTITETVNQVNILDDENQTVEIIAAGPQGVSGSSAIADDSIVEAKLDIHSDPSGTNKFLGYTSNGMEWAVPPDTQYSVGDNGLTKNNFTDALKTKLDSVESNSTADMTGSEIKSAYEGESNTNAFTDAEKTKLSGIAASANNYSISSDLLDEDNMASNSATKVPSQQSVKAYVDANSSDTTYSAGNGLTLSGTTFSVSAVALTTVQTADSQSAQLALTTQEGDVVVRTDENKSYVKNSGSSNSMSDFTLLRTPTDAVLSVNGNTGAITAAQIASAVEAASDSNTFTDADHTKLNSVESNSTADMTGAEIKTAYEGEADTNAFTDSEKTKLSGIATGATNTAAPHYTSAIPVGDGGLTQNNFTDTLKTKLDGIAANATANAGTITSVTGTSPIASSGGTTPAISISAATTSAAGSMSSADKTKLDGIASSSTANPNAINNLVEDTSPQLGGSLDVNSQDIVSTSNGDIDLDPNGSGKVVFKGNATKGSGQFKLNCENNSHGIVIKGPPHSAAASYTFTFPNDDGSADQVLKSDGSGTTSWVDQTTAYTNSSVDTHLNTSTASTNEVLSWNGSDYDWVAQSGGGSSLTVQDEGSALSTAATTLNFVGAGVAATGTGATKTITISGGGGTSDLIEIMMFT